MRKQIFRLLVVEDDESRVEWFRESLPDGVQMNWASSAGQALGVLQRDRGRTYAGILLDHDLQQRARTERDLGLSGTHVVQAIIELVSMDVPVLIHSMNPVDAAHMVKRLKGAGFWVTRIPFSDLDRDQLMAWYDEVREEWEEELGAGP